MRAVRDETEQSLSAIRLLISGWQRRAPSSFSLARGDGVEVELDWREGDRLHIALSDAKGGGFHSSVECDHSLASVVDELVAQQDQLCSSRAGDSVRALTRAGARLVKMSIVRAA